MLPFLRELPRAPLSIGQGESVAFVSSEWVETNLRSDLQSTRSVTQTEYVVLRYNLCMRSVERSRRARSIPKLKELANLRYQIRSFLSFSETSSETCGVPAQQYQLLQVIGSGPEGECASITNVAERMLLRHNSAVELVDRAQKAGLVQRSIDAMDHRRSLVELTSKGETVLGKLTGEHLKYLKSHGAELICAIEQVRAAAGERIETGESR